MATNALLIAQYRNKTIQTSHVHWDGDKLLPTLQEYYKTTKAVRELLDGGIISSLGERVTPIGPHSFDQAEPGTTIFYHRDRGDDLRVSKFAAGSVNVSYLCSGYEHVYIFYGNKWSKLS